MEQAARRRRFEINGWVEEEQPFTVSRGAQVTISPDGEWIMQHFSKSTGLTRPEFAHGFHRKAVISTRKGRNGIVMDTLLRAIVSAQWSPDSKRLAFGGQDRVYIFTVKKSGIRRTKFRVPSGRVQQVWWLDNNILKVATSCGRIYTCTVGEDNRISVESLELLHLKKREFSHIIFGDDNSFATVAIDEELTVNVHNKQGIFVWTSDTGDEMHTFHDFALSQNGKLTVAATSDGVFVYESKEKGMVLFDELGECTLCAASPDGKSFAFAHKNGVAAVSGDVVRHNNSINPSAKVSELYFTGNNTYVVVLQNRENFQTNLVRYTLSN